MTIGTSTGESYESIFQQYAPPKEEKVAGWEDSTKIPVPALSSPASTMPRQPLEKPAGASDSPKGTGVSNWQNWLAGQSYLETGGRNEKNPTSSATGYFQFTTDTVKDAMKAGIPDPRKGSYSQQSEATKAFIQKFHPDAAKAIEQGDYMTAVEKLRGRWPSLPGGSQMQAPERYEHWRNMLHGSENLHIDRTKDVPLAASALSKPGEHMYGIAIDKDIPPHPDFDKFVYLHEGVEHAHMLNLIDAGQDPVDAYHEAHDRIATPVETAAVRAHAVGLGKDPDKYLEEYKEHWRQGAAIAREGPHDRHPDAHTTQWKLDEAELGGQKFAANVGRAMTDATASPYAEGEKLEGLTGGGRSMGAGKVSEYSLKPTRWSGGDLMSYDLKKGDQAVGEVTFRKLTPDSVHLDWAGTPKGGYETSNDLGPTVVREAFRQFAAEHPGVKYITADRVSGARQATRTTGKIGFEVKDDKLKLMNPGELQRHKAYLFDYHLEHGGRVDMNSLTYQRLREEGHSHEEVQSAVERFLRQMTPEERSETFRRAMQDIGVNYP